MTEKRDRPSSVATGRGDDGTTGLLFGGDRIYKDDPRAEAYGTVDEAVAVLGLARAELATKAQFGTLPRILDRLPAIILEIQRELFVVGAELATAPGAEAKQRPGRTKVDQAMVSRLDELLAETEAHVSLPAEFVVPGQTRLSAALELARTVVRRAERRAVSIRCPDRASASADDPLLRYLNRLADLLWILARAAEQGEAREAVPSRSRE